MIYTVTLNPTLDITYHVEKIEFGEPLKAEKVEKSPGGKGINVSRALMALGYDSIAMTILGGYSGEQVLDLLQKEGLILQVVRIDSDTRTNVVILGIKDGKELVVRSEGPRMASVETERVKSLLFDTQVIPEMLVLSGSLPAGVPSNTYAELVSYAKRAGSKVIVDCSGEALRHAVREGPHLLKPNKKELEELAGKRFENESQIVEFSRKLVSGGCGIVVVSLGDEGAIWVSENIVLRGKVPKVKADTVGAGDSMVAGIVVGISQGLSDEEIFRYGLAGGLSAVMNEGAALVDRRSFDEALGNVHIKPMN